MSKHVGGYLVLELYQNTIVHLLVLRLYLCLIVSSVKLTASLWGMVICSGSHQVWCMFVEQQKVLQYIIYLEVGNNICSKYINFH